MTCYIPTDQFGWHLVAMNTWLWTPAVVALLEVNDWTSCEPWTSEMMVYRRVEPFLKECPMPTGIIWPCSHSPGDVNFWCLVFSNSHMVSIWIGCPSQSAVNVLSCENTAVTRFFFAGFHKLMYSIYILITSWAHSLLIAYVIWVLPKMSTPKMSTPEMSTPENVNSWNVNSDMGY